MKSLKMDLNVISLMVVLILCLNASLSFGRHHANATRCTEKEREALLAIKHDLLVDEYNGLTSWGSAQNQDCCRWERVYCDHQTNRVVHLHLQGITWQGTLSPKLSELHHLRYFDLSDNGFYERINFNNGSQIPETIGSLTNLRYLDLSSAMFSGGIPYRQLGNLTHLQYLNLGYNEFTHAVKNLNWLLGLSSLKYLDLAWADLSKASDWLETINKLPNLKNLTLQFCGLPPPFLATLSHIHSMNSLASVDLAGTTIDSSILYKWLSNYNTTLVYLDLSSTEMSGLIPGAFRNMRSLAHLDLSNNLIRGWSTDVFANMSSLEVLSLSYNPLERGISKPLGQLCSLHYLDFLNCGLHIKFSEFIQILSPCAHNSLRSLKLSKNDLVGSIHNLTNFLSLEELHLDQNQLSGVIPESIGQLSSLKLFHLSENILSGTIPKGICQLLLLEELQLYGNKLSGTLPQSIGQLSSLRILDLSGNQLSGTLPQSIRRLSSLQILHLSSNQLSGTLPRRIGQLSSLERLDLSTNRFSGILPKSIGQLSKLDHLNLGMNSFDGMIRETHFSKLSKLEYLDLSNNSLHFEVISHWIPPFQLSSLSLRSCKIGPHFPNWLQNQRSIFDFDISYAGISDVLPSWFWGIFANFHNYQYINLSHNEIRGTIEYSKSDVASFCASEVQFSSNQLEGRPIPSFLSNASYLDLSNNKFSQMTSFLCDSKNIADVKYLNLSNNNVSGGLPDCWGHLVDLELLDLSNNVISGKLPTTLGSLVRMETFKIRSNRLTGELPSSLKNCTSLILLDLGDNKLSRSVPAWLGVRFPYLVILILQSNQFSGSLPSQLCHLASIQVLDFSMNEISGVIPKCIYNLTLLAQEGNSSKTLRHILNITTNRNNTYYEDDAILTWKGRKFSYKSILGLVKSIDLSSNRITGEIPIETTRLVGLVSLNLSRNHLVGQIPREIGKLQSLESLDLSRNKIDGGIPTSLVQIDRLASLDLSHNNLSGEIPTGTQLQSFDPSFYAENPQLCGLPLKKCVPEGTVQDQQNISSGEEDSAELITQGFYISLGLGFAVGFWAVLGSLIFKRSWRYAYYRFLNATNDWLYVKVALLRLQLKSTPSS